MYKLYKRYFYDFIFFTSKFVYGPKYETEYIIFLFNRLVNKIKIKNVYDICSGTGCLGLTIKLLYPNINVTLLDNNIYAIECIVKNTIFHNLLVSILYENIKTFNQVICDVIVCNPPYIDTCNVNKKYNKQIFLSLDGGNNKGTSFTNTTIVNIKQVKYFILELGDKEQLEIILKKNKHIKCIDYIKPYDNMKICFCTLEIKIL